MPSIRPFPAHRTALVLGATLVAVALVIPAVTFAATGAPAAAAGHDHRVATAMAATRPAVDDVAAAVRDVGNGRLFKSQCTSSHIAMDDPIVFPGQPGASHEHVFFGNVTTDAESTLATLQGQPTSCRISEDHAAYWVPSLLQNGTMVPPRFANAYYLADGARGHIVAFPAGLKVIAGDSKATTAQSTTILGWKCANQAMEVLSPTPTLCPRGVDQVLVIRFPDCWNGHDLDSADHKSHLAYRTRGVCPAGFPVALPRLSFNVHYRLTSLNGLTLASGSISSAHADFFNAWNQSVLTALINRNLN
jgi:hypothetical protein